MRHLNILLALLVIPGSTLIVENLLSRDYMMYSDGRPSAARALNPVKGF